MDGAVPLHVIAPSGRGRSRIASSLGQMNPAVHDSVEAFRRGVGDEPCAVVVDVDGGVDSRALLELCREVADGRREWIVLLPEDDGGGGIRFRPFSAGFSMDAGPLSSFLDGEGEEDPPLELHEVLRFVARIRHDINNPLTAGLAETQLLMMDVGDDAEMTESLETIQRQLQRIQRLVKDLTRLRRPKPPARAGSGAGGSD